MTESNLIPSLSYSGIKASALMDMSQIQLQRLLADREICVHYDVTELHENLEHLKLNGWLG